MSKAAIMPLITQSHLVWKRYLQGRLKGKRITPQQLRLLRTLAKRKFLYPADIARILLCDPPTARVVVRNLEKRRWAKSEADRDDARRTRVRITAAGRKKLAAVTAALKKAAPRGFDPTGCLSADEVACLERMLRKLCEHLGQVGEA